MKKFKSARLLAFVVLIVGAVILPSRAAVTAVAGTGSDLRIYRDMDAGVTLAVQFDNSQGQAGAFQVFATGVGLFRPLGIGQLATHGQGQVQVTYSGPANLDPDAQVDPTFGVVQPSGGAGQSVTISLDAHIIHNGNTSAELKWDGGNIHLHAKGSDQSARAAASGIAAAITAQDWTTLYGYSYQPLRQAFTGPQFAAWIQSILAGRGIVLSANLTGPVAYSTAAAGFQTATVPITLTLNSDGTTSQNRGIMKLLLEGANWHFMTIDPA